MTIRETRNLTTQGHRILTKVCLTTHDALEVVLEAVGIIMKALKAPLFGGFQK